MYKIAVLYLILIYSCISPERSRNQPAVNREYNPIALGLFGALYRQNGDTATELAFVSETLFLDINVNDREKVEHNDRSFLVGQHYFPWSASIIFL